MAIAMNMNNYEIKNDDLPEIQYSDEVLCSGWHPVIEQISQQCVMTETDKRPSLPASLVMADAEVFLQKMYACQR